VGLVLLTCACGLPVQQAASRPVPRPPVARTGSAPSPPPVHRALPGARPPYKGLTDNPAYQWWVEPNGPQPDSWWGAARTPADLRDQATTMRDLGAVLFRVELPWSFVAPDRPGGAVYDGAVARDPGWPGYRWQRWDQIVATAVENGIDLVPEVLFAPEWATGTPASTSGGPNAPPTSPQLYADFVHALVTRYHDRVHYWELGNEPDYAPHSWSAGLKGYVDLMLRPGYQAVKEVDPAALVLVGGLSSDTQMSGLYKAGAQGSFDIASFHAYYEASQGDATALDHVAAAMRANGDADKPVWLTEFGLPTHAATAAAGPDAATETDPRSDAGDAKQAALIRGVFGGLGGRLQAIFYYQLRDTSVYDASGRPAKHVYWGLLSADSSRRKAGYEAFKTAGPAPAGRPGAAG
jgi:hypothetical protein